MRAPRANTSTDMLSQHFPPIEREHNCSSKLDLTTPFRCKSCEQLPNKNYMYILQIGYWFVLFVILISRKWPISVLILLKSVGFMFVIRSEKCDLYFPGIF